MDVDYGQYSCNKGCPYAAHSKCATRNSVGDGRDLENMSGEQDEDIEEFERNNVETIQHFTHEHHLKLFINGGHNYHEDKYCQACILPLTISDSFYSCEQCDFVLHEVCASFPRKTHHPLHKHPLTLYPSSPKPLELWFKRFTQGMFKCNGCGLDRCGFVYKCDEKDCEFLLDIRCASLTDSSVHASHPHKYYFNLTRGECMACKTLDCSIHFLECIECNSFLGLKCATLPSIAHYMYHKHHPVTLCYGEEDTTNLQYWCEICESKVDAKEWFYTCNFCRVTLHVPCLLGKNLYMKPNHIIKIDGEDQIKITSNGDSDRPNCDGCNRRCEDTLVFKKQDK